MAIRSETKEVYLRVKVCVSDCGCGLCSGFAGFALCLGLFGFALRWCRHDAQLGFEAQCRQRFVEKMLTS